jgi:hypothetical protein
LRTDQQEMPCAPTLREMSQPVHIVLACDSSPGSPSPQKITIAAHAKVEKCDTCLFHCERLRCGHRARKSSIDCGEIRWFHAPLRLDSHRGSIAIVRGSPTMNRVPDPTSAAF